MIHYKCASEPHEPQASLFEGDEWEPCPECEWWHEGYVTVSWCPLCAEVGECSEADWCPEPTNPHYNLHQPCTDCSWENGSTCLAPLDHHPYRGATA